MLIRFIITNYLSFREETEFNMLTGSVRRKKEHVYKKGGIGLLKTAAIYGGNGAGKSNLIRAIDLLKEAVINEDGIKDLRFDGFKLHSEAIQKPTQLQVEFIANDITYDYGLAVFEGKIVEEWLYNIQNKKEELIFERTFKENKTTIKVGRNLQQTPEDAFRFKLYEEELLADHVSLLHMLAKAKKIKEDIKSVFDWFDNSLRILNQDSIDQMLPLVYYYSAEFKKFTDELLNTFNTGVKKILIETVDVNHYFSIEELEVLENFIQPLKKEEEEFLPVPERYSHYLAFLVKENDKIVVKRLVTVHEDDNGKEVKFELSDESDGTRRLLDFVSTFFAIIFNNKIAIIDEIDQSIHPYLLKKLVAKFVNDYESKGQLIFTTHDSNLLDQDIFRQDEIWFTEKNKKGETRLYPLSDFKIRYDLDIEKGYLNGRFGAIPFLGNLDDLNWRKYAPQTS